MRVAALILVTAATACGYAPPASQIPTTLDPVARLRYSCDEDVTFPPEALEGAAGAEHANDPAAEALRAHVGGAMGLETESLPKAGWRLAARSDDSALYLAPDPSVEAGWVSVTARRGDDGRWSVTGWGGCQPQVAFDGLGIGTWQLDPIAPPPNVETTVLSVLVTERACASGRTSAGRIMPPLVIERPDAVVVIFAIRPIVAHSATCPGNPAVPTTVALPASLGDRRLLDGAFLPPRPPAAP